MPNEPRLDAAGRVAAWFCALSNLAAAVATATLARAGTIANRQIGGRMQFLFTHAGIWQVTWVLWMLAAVGLLALLLALYRHAKTFAPMASLLAIVLASAGLALDIGNDSLIAFHLPWLANAEAGAARTVGLVVIPGFEAWERVTIVLGAVAANGLYTAGGWILQILSFRLPGFPRWLALLGLAPWSAGAAMAVTGAMGRFDHMEKATVLLVPTFCAWSLGVAEFYFARAVASARAHDSGASVADAGD